MSAYARPLGSPDWLARHALTVFLVLPLVAYSLLAVVDVRFSATPSVVTGLTSLLVYWALGERLDRPAKLGAWLAVLVVWLSRHLPGATVDSFGGGVVGSTLRVGLLEALVAGPRDLRRWPGSATACLCCCTAEARSPLHSRWGC